MKWFRITLWVFVILSLLLAAILALYNPPRSARAAGTNISAAVNEHYAWNDVIGWIDFYATDNVMVGTSSVTGYASSALGIIALDCSTAPGGCGASNYGVCNGRFATHQTDGTCADADGDGWLSGWAWNDVVGWISFSCASRTGSYPCTGEQVRVDADGNFTGWAWSDGAGWISFNCAGTPQGCTLPGYDYKVKSSWAAANAIGYMESSIFDTGVPGGGILNSLLWKGTSPVGTCVSFQTAGSNNPAGPWTFMGPGADTSSYYGAPCDSGIIGGTGCAAKDTPICLNPLYTQNYRYVKYKMRLQSDAAQQATPTVTDVILNWSR